MRLLHTLFKFFSLQKLRLMAGTEIKFGLIGIEIDLRLMKGIEINFGLTGNEIEVVPELRSNFDMYDSVIIKQPGNPSSQRVSEILGSIF